MSDKVLAAHIARTIFELPHSYSALPVSRLQFMHGKYPYREEAGGGLCEEAFADHIANALANSYVPALVSALDGLLDHYVQLVNSGDAGNWDPEKEPVVIAARHALRLARGEE